MSEKKKNTSDKIKTFDMCNAISATDCTGLMQTIPMSDEELAAYHELYDYGPESEESDSGKK